VTSNGTRGRTRAARILLLLCAGLLFLAASVSARPRPDTALPIVIRGADPALAEETRAIITEAHDSMAAASGTRLTDTLRIVFVGRNQSFDSLAGGFFPDWGVGVAIAEDNLIALRSPREYPIYDQLPTILRHELAHLHLEAMLGQRRPPRWMHEGYAQQFAHQWGLGDDWLVARAVFTGSVLPLADIDGVNSFRDAKAQLAYVQSYLAMGYFLKRYGWDGLMLFARTMRRGGSWDQGFMQATGANYTSFQKEFDSYLEDKFDWAIFLHDTALLWIILTVIFVVLYLIKRHRSARKLADWQKQETIEDALYAPFEQPGREPEQPARDD